MNITGVCPYETPCGWCSKWDKKIPKRYRDSVVTSGKDKDLEDIKSGKGLPSTDAAKLFKEPWISNVP
jgi:hypothetical protein